MATAKQKADEAAWRARSDMDTLSQAAAINADRARMAAVKQVAQTEIKKLQTVVGKTAAPKPAPRKK